MAGGEVFHRAQPQSNGAGFQPVCDPGAVHVRREQAYSTAHQVRGNGPERVVSVVAVQYPAGECQGVMGLEPRRFPGHSGLDRRTGLAEALTGEPFQQPPHPLAIAPCPPGKG